MGPAEAVSFCSEGGHLAWETDKQVSVMLPCVRGVQTGVCEGKGLSRQKEQFERAPGGMKINLENVSGRQKPYS